MHFLLGKCPIYGKPVIESGKGYGCSGWKEIAKKKITKFLLRKNQKMVSYMVQRRIIYMED